MHSLVRVVTSSESAARDSSAIAGGIPSRALMQRAGAAAAAEIALRYRDRLDSGVLVLIGPGNNGGDGWVIARALRSAGVRVRVAEPVPAKTDDARAERTLAIETFSADEITALSTTVSDRGEAIVLDALLGTGATGAPRGEIAAAVAVANEMRARGAVVVAIDVPSGVDASTGATAGVAIHADLTLAFGAMKRGLVCNRDTCGAIAVLDIGLPAGDGGDLVPRLVDERWVAENVPPIGAEAHKGIRKKIAIVGGAQGMAGATILAARAALRSSAGMVKVVVAKESFAAVQEAEPYALASTWPVDDAEVSESITGWADAVVIGPGLGRSNASRETLERVLRVWRGPTLLDADALTLWEGRTSELAALLGGRPALITPHPVEFSRISGASVEEVLNSRFDIGARVAAELSVVVLLKGVPTVITAADGRRLVSASGTPALAAAGSGDVLSGIGGVMLAQIGDPFAAAAVSAWVHGRAAERVPVPPGSGVRGIVLDDIVNELRDAWTFDTRPNRYPVLAELPGVPLAQ
ncbi:MAG: NAD(P)H-hydrate dehydratase [Gemmatimonadaceae bacterium]